RSVIAALFVAGGALTALTPAVFRWLGPRTDAGSATSLIVLVAAGVALPGATLSAVPPCAVKAGLRGLDRAGRVAGGVSAVSTTGAIVGTFLTGFLLVSEVPTAAAFVGVGTAASGFGVALAVWARWQPRWWIGGVGVILLAGIGGWRSPAPCDHESAYRCIRVEPVAGDPDGRLLRLDTGRHSYVNISDPTKLDFAYSKTFADVVDTEFPRGEPIRAVHIGGGGFTIPRYVDATRPGSTNVVLELDPALEELARRELGLDPVGTFRTLAGDARITLRDEPEASFDVAFGDAFNHLAVPWHLTTREFLEEVRSRLVPDGLYVLNVIDYPPRRFLAAEVRTIRQVFDHVSVLAPGDLLFGARSGGNYVVVASDRELAVDLYADGPRRGPIAVLSDDELGELIRDASVLTDDFAPADQLLGR
ncbi:MAG: fused MFS/spermidine synthase, partial [Acidimicrobiia bacterium]|nr:fused MFS/spermidine synthase [Acidimicrobiia bacterium]